MARVTKKQVAEAQARAESYLESRSNMLQTMIEQYAQMARDLEWARANVPSQVWITINPGRLLRLIRRHRLREDGRPLKKLLPVGDGLMITIMKKGQK